MFSSASRRLISGKVWCRDFLKEVPWGVLAVFSVDNPSPIKEDAPETLFMKDLQKSHEVVEFKMKRVEDK